MGGNYKWFTLSKEHNIESTIGHIAGNIDLAEDQSVTNPYIENLFVPVRYQLVFIGQDRGKNGVSFKIQRINPENNWKVNEEIELDENYRRIHESSFFPYINLSKIDLSPFQIFHSVNPKNYKDNSFVFFLYPIRCIIRRGNYSFKIYSANQVNSK